MGATEFLTGNALTNHRWTTSLAVEAAVNQFLRKFMGSDFNKMIRILKDLNKNAGDKITYGLRMKLTGDGVEGDNQLEGTAAEEALSFYSDNVFISQRRKGTKSKGQMSEQRIPYNILKEGKEALAIWFGEDYDQQLFMYLAGNRGVVTSGWHFPIGWTGRASNTIAAPDTAHQIYAGDAKAQADLDEADVMSLQVVEKCISQAETTDPMIQPFMDEGELKFILLMHTWDQHNLRISSSSGDWQDLTKNARERTSKNPIWLNSLGEYAGVIMHKHRNVIRPTSTVSRSLFLGAQAAVIAWGGSQISENSRNRFSMHVETDDRGNQVAVSAASIYGISETTFNSKRFGMIAVDSYCTDPNS